MSLEAFRKRVRELLAQERENNPLTWWYLSFADDCRPVGSRFLGAAIVRAHGMADAVDQAHRRGINPGGEVQGVGAPTCFSPPESFCNRLLTAAEVKDMDEALLGGRARA